MKEQPLKSRILSASRNMLFEEGFKSLSMRKIANEIGVSATSIYLYFKNKDHLLHTLMEESIETLSVSLEQAANSETSPAGKIEAVIKAYVHFALENPSEYQIIYLVKTDDMARYPKEKFRKARRGYDLLANAIEEGVLSGELQVRDSLIAAYSIWAQLHGIISVVMNNRLDKRIDQDSFIESSIEQIVHGFLVRSMVNNF